MVRQRLRYFAVFFALVVLRLEGPCKVPMAFRTCKLLVAVSVVIEILPDGPDLKKRHHICQ